MKPTAKAKADYFVAALQPGASGIYAPLKRNG